jgi:hypothetical protein
MLQTVAAARRQLVQQQRHRSSALATGSSSSSSARAALPAPPRLVLPSQHLWPLRRSYALKVGRRRRKGGSNQAAAGAAADGQRARPSTQDARISGTPVNSVGTNFSGQAPATGTAAAARPDAFETAEHAARTLHRVYTGIKDMESSNEGLVVVSPSLLLLLLLLPSSFARGTSAQL